MFKVGKTLLWFCIFLQEAYTSENKIQCTSGGKKCHFPFFYDGKNHSKCLSYMFTTWCAVTYDGYGDWGYCAKTCPEVGPQILETTQPISSSSFMGLPLETKPAASPKRLINKTEAEEGSTLLSEPTNAIEDPSSTTTLSMQSTTKPKVETTSRSTIFPQSSSTVKADIWSVISTLTSLNDVEKLSTVFPKSRSTLGAKEMSQSPTTTLLAQLITTYKAADKISTLTRLPPSSSEIEAKESSLAIVSQIKGEIKATMSTSTMVARLGNEIEETTTVISGQATGIPLQHSELTTTKKNASTPAMIGVLTAVMLFALGMTALICRMRRRKMLIKKNLKKSSENTESAIQLQERSCNEINNKDLAAGDALLSTDHQTPNENSVV